MLANLPDTVMTHCVPFTEDVQCLRPLLGELLSVVEASMMVKEALVVDGDAGSGSCNSVWMMRTPCR
jgi:hypothetical protein